MRMRQAPRRQLERFGEALQGSPIEHAAAIGLAGPVALHHRHATELVRIEVEVVGADREPSAGEHSLGGDRCLEVLREPHGTRRDAPRREERDDEDDERSKRSTERSPRSMRSHAQLSPSPFIYARRVSRALRGGAPGGQADRTRGRRTGCARSRALPSLEDPPPPSLEDPLPSLEDPLPWRTRSLPWRTRSLPWRTAPQKMVTTGEVY